MTKSTKYFVDLHHCLLGKVLGTVLADSREVTIKVSADQRQGEGVTVTSYSAKCYAILHDQISGYFYSGMSISIYHLLIYQNYSF